jgi:hypothetical protein
MRQNRHLVLGILLAFSLLLILSVSGLAQSTAVIDFEGIPAGTIVSNLTKDIGISGDPIDGFVTVRGHNPDFLPANPNAAMIFDATCPPGGVPADCSGDDGDLIHPEWGKTLIISEDLDGSDPDDGDTPGSVFLFDFRNWGSGSVTVESINVQDVEEEQQEAEDAKIELFSDGLDGTLIATVDIPHTGNGNFTTVFANVDNVGTMRVDLEGSGMIDNVRISTEPTAVELLSFTAKNQDGRNVAVDWSTAAEIDNYGFNLYRSAKSDLVTATKIHFEPAGGGSGHTYAYLDTPPSLGSWWYWLADVDTNGKETFHGPLRVDLNGDAPETLSHQIFMPISIFHLR